jgi:serine/threonine-protein kinase
MARLLAKAARGLALAHDQQIVHRDIKPANILLEKGRSGGVYLCDFGLGRDLEIATSEQMRDGAGTPLYMAPERLLRCTADEIKCDIYSMGVTLFEATTLERPFHVPEEISYPTLATFLASAKPRRPDAIRAGFPTELESIIMKAMNSDHAKRYESAHLLANDLDRVQITASSYYPRPHIEPRSGQDGDSRPGSEGGLSQSVLSSRRLDV